MGRASKQPIDQAAALQARALKDAFLAELLRGFHAKFRLWRLCPNRGCHRACDCRGDALACGARRWPVGRSCLRQLLTARGTPRAKAQLADQHVTEWSEKDGVLTETQRITITWGPPQW
jgi:hypothetical protein